MVEEKTYVWCTYRDWSFRILEGLQDLEGWRTGLVVTTPGCFYDLSKFEKRGITVLRDDPKKTLKKGGEGYRKIIDLQPETIFYYGWSWMVPEDLLNLCPNVTLHPGKLPKDRGGSPLQNQIRNGETWSYANVLKMSNRLDEGPVYMRARLSLEGNIDDVWARMTAAGCRITRDYLRRLANGNFEPKPQVDEEPSFYQRVKPQQAELKPAEQSALLMHNIIRAHSETDPNTYVRKAFFVYGAHTLVIDRSTLDSRISEQRTCLVNINTPKPENPDIFLLCELVNEGKAAATLEGSDGQLVYITRLYVKSL